ncbi:MAG: helix-turn-helix domain-containing protein [Thermoproteota archaeon]|nr:helix-turn-helix domain-containing protein [Thermoproteota archaeon]
MERLTDEDTGILKGTTLDVYRLLLTSSRPLGVREIQRQLNLSSPSVVQYHLEKLERAGLLRREKSNYVISKALLDNCVRISRFLIPRYLFYTIFAVALLLIQLILLKPVIPSREYFFSTAAIALLVLVFCYETVRVWLKRKL